MKTQETHKQKLYCSLKPTNQSCTIEAPGLGCMDGMGGRLGWMGWMDGMDGWTPREAPRQAIGQAPRQAPRRAPS